MTCPHQQPLFELRSASTQRCVTDQAKAFAWGEIRRPPAPRRVGRRWSAGAARAVRGRPCAARAPAATSCAAGQTPHRTALVEPDAEVRDVHDSLQGRADRHSHRKLSRHSACGACAWVKDPMTACRAASTGAHRARGGELRRLQAGALRHARRMLPGAWNVLSSRQGIRHKL